MFALIGGEGLMKTSVALFAIAVLFLVVPSASADDIACVAPTADLDPAHRAKVQADMAAYRQCLAETKAEESQRAADFQRLGYSCDDISALQQTGATMKHVGSTYLAEAERRKKKQLHDLGVGMARFQSEMSTWTPDFFTQSDTGDGGGYPNRIIQGAKDSLAQSRCYLADRADKLATLDQLLPLLDQEAAKVAKMIADEQACRATPTCMAARVAKEICNDIATLKDVKRQIADEKANPGGVVDLELLHGLGERQQANEAAIRDEKAQYLKLAKKPFSEALCH